MDVDATIKSVIVSVEGRLIDAGYVEAAKDTVLRQAIENALRARLILPSNPALISPPSAPDLSDVAEDLNQVAELLRKERDDPPEVGCHCAVFLGAAAHYGPPAYPRPDGGPQPAYVNGPLGASELAKVLCEESAFATEFPKENAWDLMRVSTWFERNSKLGRRGLEKRIKDAVETNKLGSEMISLIGSWPCRTFYTTNYDTHLEKALLEHHSEVFIWIYRPTTVTAPGEKAGRDAYDPRRHWWRMTKNPDDPALYEYEHWTGPDEATSTYNQTGQAPPEPPADAIVVCKLHGDVRERGSVVITDEDYTKFLCRFTKTRLPNRLLLPLQSAIIFIGYSLRDYNMRYVLTSMREELDTAWTELPASYSVDLRPDPLLKATWQRDNLIFFLEHNLWDVVPAITERLNS